MLSVNKILDYEKKYSDLRYICGIDEAGRGPLAGPVCCAAVIMPKGHYIEGVDDSKKLTETKREQLYEIIIKTAVAYNIVMIDHATIDKINILNATRLGMEKAAKGLKILPDIILVDAVGGLDLPCPSESIIKGDELSYNIAAASILAKVARDRYMRQMDKIYPYYDFKNCKGYATPNHLTALKKWGSCPIHRLSFLTHLEVADNKT
ncbi:MAG TPA: ribonuclease HII [Clostridiales bacterium]|nr:ribonuclease HII [Clostridiales bacterium]